MSKLPYTPEFRAMVSQEYLDRLGYKYQIGSKTLKQWVAKYRLYGIIAFQNKKGNATYSSDFKKMCVEAVLSGDGSVDDIVAKYNISSRDVLRNWISKYNANRELKGYDPQREVYMAEARRKATIGKRKEIVSSTALATIEIIKKLRVHMMFLTARFIPGSKSTMLMAKKL